MNALLELSGLLSRASELAADAGEPRWSTGLGRLADRAAASLSDSDARGVLHDVLGLYGGMGSFNDLVLQDSGGVRPEQQELGQLRARIFDAARNAYPTHGHDDHTGHQ